MVKRVVSGAHYGTRDWLMQRVTALVMAVFTLCMLGYWLWQPRLDYVAWRAWFQYLPVRLLGLLFVLSLLLHAWVGMRDIFMDYVHPTVLRLVLHVLVIMLLVIYAAWAVQILWGVV
jgi:succinate dehydrogenase / fumarate reductase membrane anchor subunit